MEQMYKYIAASADNPTLKPIELVDLMCSQSELVANKDAKAALEALRILFRYVEIFGIGDKVNSNIYAYVSKYANDTRFFLRLFLSQVWLEA